VNTQRTTRCLTAVGAILLASAPGVAQQAVVRSDRAAHAEEHIASLIERLEIGMSALEELGRRDALEIVQRIADELREEHAHRGEVPPEENDEIKTVRRRLKVMRTAVDAFLEADRHDAAGLVEHAMHARELSIEGRRDAEANRIREAAPNRAQLAEALGGAARLYREWNMPDRAEALVDLAETYANQWRRRQQASRDGRVAEREREPQHESEQEREPTLRDDLDSLARRIEIIRYARDAFARAGDEANASVLERVVHFGELALTGVTDERLRQAAEDVPSKVNLAEYLNSAANRYSDWGRKGRAAACRGLAKYYGEQARATRREGEEEPVVERTREPEVDRGRGADGLEGLKRRIEILRSAHGAFRRAGHVESAHTVGRFLRMAELQREGADVETLAKASEGLSMEAVVERLLEASKLYHDWGHEDRATACYSLAEFYAQRERANAEGERAEGGRDRGVGDDVRARLRELQRRTDELQEELRDIRAAIKHLTER